MGGPRAGLRVARRRTGRGHPHAARRHPRRARRRRRPARGRPARQPAGDLVRAAGHPVPRRAQRRTAPPAHPAQRSPSRQLGAGARGPRRDVDRLPRPAAGDPAPRHRRQRGRGAARVRLLPRPPPPRRRFGGRGGPRPRRGLQALARRAARPPRRSTAPAHRASPVELGAAVLPAAHRVGRRRRPGQGAALPPRPADQGRPAAPVPRRCRRDEAARRRSRRPRPAGPSHRRVPRPHRHAQGRARQPHRRRRRADRLRLLAADPGRQTAQRPLHPPAPPAQAAPRPLARHPVRGPALEADVHRARAAAEHRPRRRRGRQGRPGRGPRRRLPAPAPSHPGHPGHQPRHVASRRSPPFSGTAP